MHRMIFLYYLILALALLTNFVTMRLRKLPVGRAWEALREDEIACRSLGINTTNTKLTAFAIGAMFGGFAGSFFAVRQGFVSPESFNFLESAIILAIVVLGGMGSQIGVAIAAIVLVGGPEVLRNLTFLQSDLRRGLRPERIPPAALRRRHGGDDGLASARPDLGTRTLGDLERAQGHFRLAREGRTRLMRWLQDPILDVQHLTMRFGGLVAINDLSFQAGRGDITALIGPNGAGKTTVFNCITGFYKPTEGMIALRKPDGSHLLLERLPGFDINWKAKVARTFQNIRLFSGMTVLENLLVAQHNPLMIASGFTFLGVLGIGGYRKAEKEAIEKAKFWLEKTRLIDRADDPAGDLPYGDQRRLEIARAMCTDPLLLCLDEPAAGLNPRESHELNQLLLSIRKDHGTSILLIEHDMSVVMEISDHVVVLDYGIKISDGTPVRGQERSQGHRRLSGRGRRRGREGRSGDRRMSTAGANTRDAAARQAATARQPLLSVRGVKTFYGNIIALKGVDMDVNEGEIVTLIGANGAGKSTLMMTIFGNPRAREGTITYAGRDITQMPTHEIARLSIAQSPEGRRIFPRMTVFENLQMGASINGMAHFDQDLERVCTLFPRLKERLQQRGGTLSGGEQQMLAIARALMSRPKLLLLDEPSLGLAPLIVKQIFHDHQGAQREGRHDGLPRRAERLPRPQARPSRLCDGDRQHHHERHRQGTARESAGPGGLSRRRASLMQGILYEEPSIWLFLLVTVIMGGWAAWMTGRAIALTWRPFWNLILYLFILGAAVRFIHFALFDGTLLSIHYYAVDTIVLLIIGSLGFQYYRARHDDHPVPLALRADRPVFLAGKGVCDQGLRPKRFQRDIPLKNKHDVTRTAGSPRQTGPTRKRGL